MRNLAFTDFLIGVGILFVLEGLLFAASPAWMRRAMKSALATPDNMRGRVGSLNSLFVGASNELGEFRAGMSAGLFGTVPAVVIGGFGTLVVVGLWMWGFPPLRRIDRFSEATAGLESSSDVQARSAQCEEMAAASANEPSSIAGEADA